MGEWFTEWFNTKYYHILYKNRDDSEASAFIDRLTEYLAPQAQSHFLDVACGKGRHSIYLNSKGFNVTGIDISPNNIEEAKQHENATLHFAVADMRQPFAKAEFDIALNLFTSFGYFDSNDENLLALQNICTAMKTGGRFVLDFFNAEKVLKQIVPHEVKTIEGITFTINKKMEGNRIIKTIGFESEGGHFTYTEKVEAINKQQFEQLFAQTDFEIMKVFGDYQLSPYNAQTSDRIIFVLQKAADKC